MCAVDTKVLQSCHGWLAQREVIIAFNNLNKMIRIADAVGGKVRVIHLAPNLNLIGEDQMDFLGIERRSKRKKKAEPGAPTRRGHEAESAIRCAQNSVQAAIQKLQEVDKMLNEARRWECRVEEGL